MATITSLGFSIFSTYNGAGTSSARRDLNSLSSDLDKNNAKLKKAATSFFSLSSAALTLGPSLIPISGGLLAVGGAAVSMSASAAGAAGVFGAALMGNVKQVLTLNTGVGKLQDNLELQKTILSQLTPGTKAYNKEQVKVATAQDRYNHALDQATPLQRTFLTSVLGMKDAWSGFLRATQPETLTIASVAVKGLTDGIKQLAPAAHAVAPLALEVANAFKHWTDNNLKGWVTWVSTNGVPILANFVTIGKNLGRVFGDMLKAFAPLGDLMANKLAVISAMLRGWADGGGFTRFLTTVKANGPAIGEFFKALAGALKQVSTALVGLGPLSLSLTTTLLRLVAALPPGVIQAIAVGIMVVRAAMLAYALGATAAAAATLIWDVAQTALIATMIAFDVAVAPAILIMGLIVLAVAAIGFAIFELVTHWNTVWHAISSTAVTVWDFLKAHWNLLIIAIGPIGWLVALGTHWSQVWTGMKVAAAAVWAAMQAGWQAFTGAMRAVYNAMSAALKVSWGAMWDALRAAANAAWAALKASWQAFTDAMRAVYNAMSTALKASWSAMWAALRAVANAAWTALKASGQAFNTVFIAATKALHTALVAAWNAGAKAIGAAWSAIKKLVRDPIQAVVNVVYNNGIVKLWNTVAGAFGAPKLGNFTLPNFAQGGPIRGPGTGTSDSIVARVSNNEHVVTAQEVAGAGGHAAVAAQRTAWARNAGGSHARTMGDHRHRYADGGGVAGPGAANNGPTPSSGGGSGIIGTIAGDIGGALGALAKLALGAIGAVVNPLIQKAADAGKTAVRDIIPGTPLMELLIAGGTTTSTATTTNAGGTNPQDTPVSSKNKGMIQMMADTIKNWITAHDIAPTTGGNTAGAQKWADAQVGKPYSLGGNFGTTFDCSQYMSGIAQIILGHAASPLFTTFAFTGAKQGPATFEKDLKAPFMVGVTNAGVGHMAGTLNGKNYEATPPAVRSGPSARGYNDPMFPMQYGMKASTLGGVIPAGSHLAIIDQALAAAGVPPPGTKAEWEAGLNTLITRESNWNAGAINTTDSNAAAGHPSEGLAQVIAPTFAAYRVASLPNNLLDPVANVAAAIRYIVATYGNITNVQQANASLPPKGYWGGTRNAKAGWRMVDENGDEWINFHGGDKVLPHGKHPKHHSTGDSTRPVVVNVENHWHGNPTKEAVQHVQGDMADCLRQAVHAGVGGRNN